MKLVRNIVFIVLLVFSFNSKLLADTPHFVDFKFILNESTAGKKAQDFLKNKLNNGIKNLKNLEKNIQEEEKKIIQQKKVLSAEEYKSKVTKLRSKVASLQKKRSELYKNVADQRSKARNELLKNLNPVIQEYMKKNKIRMVIDKKSILLADESLDLTQEIIAILNKRLTSIKLK
tara:strand:+ start:852 stop:1376 length:525 start_codon:yes stop_codon:yes gene_type:complete